GGGNRAGLQLLRDGGAGGQRLSRRGGRLPLHPELRGGHRAGSGNLGRGAARYGGCDPGAERATPQLSRPLAPHRGSGRSPWGRRRSLRTQGDLLPGRGASAAIGAARLQRHARLPARAVVRVEQHIPREVSVELDDVLTSLADRSTPSLGPFCDDAIGFCARLSEALFRDRSRARHPQLVALAFALRPAELERLRRAFAALETDDSFLVPRGVAFHVPPANVDTVFVYSWMFSFLAGNRNIIRLPGGRTEAMEIL